MQAAPYAVDKLEELMEYAESEPVKLKAATEILDRAGVRGGIEVDTTVNLDVRSAAELIAERLDRLAKGAIVTAAVLSQDGVDIVDAEVVEEPVTDRLETRSTSDDSSKEPPVEEIHNGVDDSGERPAEPKEENITNA
jgi:hypothetical protein